MSLNWNFTNQSRAILDTIVNTEAVDRKNSKNPDHFLLREVGTKLPTDPDDVGNPLVSSPPGLCLSITLVVHQQADKTEYSETTNF